VNSTHVEETWNVSRRKVQGAGGLVFGGGDGRTRLSFALRLIFQVRQTLAGHGVELEGAGKARAQEERHWCDATRTRTRAHTMRARVRKKKNKRNRKKSIFSVALNRALVVQCNNL
jgi:hypothetical protein